MNKSIGISISKFEENSVNEDAVRAEDALIAVSDGAGGGGIYADKWSKFLLKNLPKEPFGFFKSLDDWIGSIWESFYKEYESIAKEQGGLLLNKFYDEGSLATLVAIWRTSPNEYQWITYGDSVAFHYNKRTHILEYSIDNLVEFNNPPYLINYINELQEKGYHQGVFHTDDDSIVFVASDTLSHYILMMYQVEDRQKKFQESLETAIKVHSKNSQLINNVLFSGKKICFDCEIETIMKEAKCENNFKQYLKGLKEQYLIGHDDYSFAFFD